MENDAPTVPMLMYLSLLIGYFADISVTHKNICIVIGKGDTVLYRMAIRPAQTILLGGCAADPEFKGMGQKAFDHVHQAGFGVPLLFVELPVRII
jgi:hypothetical protein